MSLSIEPNKGIRLTIGPYSAIKTWQGGGKFWEHDFQLTLRQGELKEFLPRATEEAGTVLFQQVVGGNEVVSSSLPFSRLEQIPSQQIETLRREIADLKAKAEDPNCDANKRKMIEAFRLPDPQKDSELYRFYGSGQKKRLIVLWGVEKEAGSAIAPLKVLESMSSGRQGFSSKNWMLLLLVLIAGALATLFFLQSQSRPKTPGPSENPPNPSSPIVSMPPPVSSTPQNSPQSKGNSSQANNPNISDPAGPENPEQSPQKITPQPTGSPSASVAAIGLVPVTEPTTPHSPPQPLENNIPMDNSQISNGERTENPAPFPKQSVTPPPAESPSDSVKPTVVKPETEPVYPQNSPQSTGNNTSAQNPPISDRSPSGSPTSTVAPSSLTNQTTSQGELSKPPIVDPAPTSTPHSSGALGVPSSPTQIKISAQPEGETLNGLVLVNLTAIGLNAGGLPVSEGFSITKWTIDGVVQYEPQGQALAAPNLPVKLKSGVHRILLEAKGDDRKIISSQVNVEIKVIEQSTVEVTPVP